MPWSSGIGRRRVRVSKRTSWVKHLDAFSRHPLTLVAAGFVFTSVIGTIIQDRQQRYESQEADTRNALRAITEVKAAVYELYARMQFSNDDPPEGKALEDEHDALAKLSFVLQDKQFAIENALPHNGLVPDRHILNFEGFDDAIWTLYRERRATTILRCMNNIASDLEFAFSAAIKPEARIDALRAAAGARKRSDCPPSIDVVTAFRFEFEEKVKRGASLNPYDSTQK
jgi:hypothetical protein